MKNNNALTLNLVIKKTDGKMFYDLPFEVPAGMEYMMMTDHNRTVLGELPSVEDMTVIPGVEPTFPMGHSD